MERKEEVSETYEQLRDSLPAGEGQPGTLWRDADRWMQYLRETYQNIAADETLSDEGRHQKAKAAEERTRPKIAASLKQAKEKAAKESRSAYNASIPLPDGATLATSRVNDAGEMLALQSEANRLATKLENLRAAASASGKARPGGNKGIRLAGDLTTDFLRDAFAEAFERGGLEGKIQAHAALRVAEAEGVEPDVIVSPYREQRHYESAEHARRMDTVAFNIPSEKVIPKNPFTLQATRGSDFDYRPRNKGFISSERPKQFKRNSRPSWK
jgi:hypothetical protein